MARHAFTPPDDTDDDVLGFLASGRPAAAVAPAPVALASAPPAPVSEPRAKAPAASPATRARRSAAGVAKAARPVGPKRIGLYMDVPTWAQLKKISLQRAERGQAADFTSIVLEALRAQYPDGRWDKR